MTWICGETTRATGQITVDLGRFRLYAEGIQVGASRPKGADSTVSGPKEERSPHCESIIGPQGERGLHGADSTVFGPERGTGSTHSLL
jgi:hypothetical protein